MMINLGVLSTVFALILTSFYVTTGDSANVLFLSRAVSVICLLLWIGFLLFRHRHATLFEDEPLISLYIPWSWERSTVSRRFIITAAISLVLLGFCIDSLICSLMRQPPLIRYVLTLFVVPLVTRAYTQSLGVRALWPRGTYTLDSLMDYSLGAMVNTALFIVPCLVILGWIMKVPMTLHFSLMETICFTLAIWIVGYQLHDGTATYFTGASLVLLYIMIALGMGFALKGEYGS